MAGPAYAGLDDLEWARVEARRLEELRLLAVERLAGARIAAGEADVAVADLEAHAAHHPWREEAWRLLAHALYLGGRQVEALAVLRRARVLLDDELGLAPTAAVGELERRILEHDPGLRGDAADALLHDTAAAYVQVAPPDPSARLQTTVTLLRDLALSGADGLVKARANRAAAVAAAEGLDDPRVAARVIGLYDVPAVWTRADDPEQAARVVATARRIAARLVPGRDDALLTRVLATIGLESRGTGTDAAARAAGEAERLARALGDPASLAFALNAVWMQSFGRAGLARRRAAIGAELLALAARHGLVAFEILGHLIRMQALGAAGDLAAADTHAAAAERLGDEHHRPLVGFFVTWYRAMRASVAGDVAVVEVEDAYAHASASSSGAGMPGVTDGLPALAALCLHLRHGTPPPDPGADWGPSAPWAVPVVLAARGERGAARAALRGQSAPPPDHLLELRWALTAIAARAVGDDAAARRAATQLRPARGELAGAGSGLVTLGPVAELL